MHEHIDTIIIGAGQAGLSLGYCLSRHDQSFVILEKADSLVPAWRSRWDSFTLVLPNWTLQLPDYAYQGDDPDGFLTRDEVVRYMEGFAATFNPDIRFGSQVVAVDRDPAGGYLVRTTGAVYRAANVAVATGTYQRPRIPDCYKGVAESITQLHTSQYRNPDLLPPGAVLVVGSGQSGCQIAEELYQSGRQVYLCVGGATRIPRTYRGRDSIYWLQQISFFDQTVDSLSSPRDRFIANPFLTGKDGGRSLDLHEFARDGVVLLGRLQDVHDGCIYLAPDLHDNLTRTDNFVAQVTQAIDKYIADNNIEAEPAPAGAGPRDGYAAPIVATLDLAAAGISTILWATGYQFDFSWINLPLLDGDGYPEQDRGVTRFPGLYFVGLHWLHKRRSGLPWGVGDDAAHIAAVIAGRE